MSGIIYIYIYISKFPGRLWGPPNLLFNGYRASFPGIKRPGREVKHSSPSIAEVKLRMGGDITPASTICLHDLDRENFTFIYRIYTKEWCGFNGE
jgi:hypothetical protein